MFALPLVLLACATEPARPLPAPEPLASDVSLRRVKVPGVEALIARPQPEGGGGEATLLLVEALDDAAAEQARALAERGRIALAISPETETGAARAYLAGMPGVPSPPEVRCLRALCPESTE